MKNGINNYQANQETNNHQMHKSTQTFINGSHPHLLPRSSKICQDIQDSVLRFLRVLQPFQWRHRPRGPRASRNALPRCLRAAARRQRQWRRRASAAARRPRGRRSHPWNRRKRGTKMWGNGKNMVGRCQFDIWILPFFVLEEMAPNMCRKDPIQLEKVLDRIWRWLYFERPTPWKTILA